ncbi:unnamed protein product [Cuscuta europaea]|uniref:Retrotransposon gag domain-containing protein n=1 Tax=Cuscuta europaea TaxID=41803 RepID=A0A9P1EAG2_CUSEU|nr:unnamed protein product [Cuscuta europaea]
MVSRALGFSRSYFFSGPMASFGSPTSAAQPVTTAESAVTATLPSATETASPTAALSSRDDPLRSHPYSMFSFTVPAASWVPPIFTWTPSAPTFRPMVQPQRSPPPDVPHHTASTSGVPRFAGPTLSGSPGVHLPSVGTIGQQPTPMPTSYASLTQGVTFGGSVTQIVTSKLVVVEDYSPCRTQFESFVVANGLLGFLDGSLPAPPMYTYDLYQAQSPNPEYYYWLKLDQAVRAWLFATLSRDILMEVHSLKNSVSIWQRLESRFMAASLARSMELKQMLQRSKKKENQSMEEYVRGIQTIADNLAAINAPVSNADLIEITLLGLGPGYESLVGALTLFPEGLTFDSLGTKLVHQDARLRYQQSLEPTIPTPAFAASSSAGGVRIRALLHLRPISSNLLAEGVADGVAATDEGATEDGTGSRRRTGLLPITASNSSNSLAAVQISQISGDRPGSPSFENSFGSVPPPVVCQICYSPGHSAAHMTSNEGHNFGEGAPPSFQ